MRMPLEDVRFVVYVYVVYVMLRGSWHSVRPCHLLDSFCGHAFAYVVRMSNLHALFLLVFCTVRAALCVAKVLCMGTWCANNCFVVEIDMMGT